VNPAGLTLSGCLAYALANETASPLLYIGDDFSATDPQPAIELTKKGQGP